jgi:hypothetical protein
VIRHRLAGRQALDKMAAVEACGAKSTASGQRRRHLDVSDEERREAERTGLVVRKKLLEIMDLQADIDALIRDSNPTPFGSAKWKNASLETLQRLVLMVATQLIFFEPDHLVAGNDEFKVTADKLLQIILGQLKSLGDKPTRE